MTRPYAALTQQLFWGLAITANVVLHSMREKAQVSVSKMQTSS